MDALSAYMAGSITISTFLPSLMWLFENTSKIEVAYIERALVDDFMCAVIRYNLQCILALPHHI